MSRDKRRRTELKKFISATMADNPRFDELLAKMDSLPSEYIEELYMKLEVMKPLESMQMQAMVDKASKELKSMIELSLRYHE
jgi:hypothetical protein